MSTSCYYWTFQYPIQSDFANDSAAKRDSTGRERLAVAALDCSIAEIESGVTLWNEPARDDLPVDCSPPRTAELASTGSATTNSRDSTSPSCSLTIGDYRSYEPSAETAARPRPEENALRKSILLLTHPNGEIGERNGHLQIIMQISRMRKSVINHGSSPSMALPFL